MNIILKFLENIKVKLGIIGELIGFLWTHKLWWSIPIIIVMLLLMSIIIFGQTTGVGPFIYPLF